MTCISITNFAGLMPEVSARNKGKANAQIAHNCLLTDGSLRPMPAWKLFANLQEGTYTENSQLYENVKSQTLFSGVDFRDAVFLVDKPFAKSVLVGLSTEGPTASGINTNVYEAAHADSNAKLLAGLPTPGLSTYITDSDISYSSQMRSLKPVNRIIGITFCRRTSTGLEESTILVLPDQYPFGIMFEGDIVEIDITFDMDLIAAAGITHIRLYRTISGLDSGEQVANELDTDWHLIDTLPVVENLLYNDGGAVTTDPMDLYLAGHFYPPAFNAGHFGLSESGWFYMASCDGRIAMSERYLHHAWPTENQLTIPESIVDIVEHYDSLFIGTNSAPYVAALGPGEGEQGFQGSAVPFPQRLPCLSRTMVKAPAGAIYASYNGLVSLSKSGQRVITSGITNPGDTLYDNGTSKASIGLTKLGAFWNGCYYGFCCDVSPDLCAPTPETIPDLVISGTLPPTACMDEDFLYVLVIQGGIGPYTMEVDGTIPETWSVVLAGSNIIVSGPAGSSVGSYTFTVTVGDTTFQSAASEQTIDLEECHPIDFGNVYVGSSYLAAGSIPFITIDANTNTVINTTNFTDQMLWPQVDANNTYVYHYSTNTLRRTQLSDYTIQDVATGVNFNGGPVLISADGLHVYALDFDFARLRKIRILDGVITNTYVTPDNCTAMCWKDEDREKIYLPSNGGETMRVFNTLTGLFETDLPGVAPGTYNQGRGCAVASDTGYVYSCQSDSGSTFYLTQYHPNGTVANAVNIPTLGYDVAITPDGAYAYVVNRAASGKCYVVRLSDLTLVDTISIGGFPVCVRINTDGTFAYASCETTNEVYVIDLSDNSVAAIIPMGALPHGLTIYDPA